MSDLEDSESEVEIPNDYDSDKEDTISKDNIIATSLSLPKSQPLSKIKSELQLSNDLPDEDDEDDDLDDDNDEDSEVDDPEDLGDEPSELQTMNIPENVITSDLITANILSPINSDVESDDEDHLQKLDKYNIYDNIYINHPECFTASSDEIEVLSQVIREDNIIIDKNHTTNPILTKYEKTKILGQRTKQLNSGCSPYIDVPNNIIDTYLIAQMELKAKQIPIIIRRPISSKRSEYWKLADLEQIY